MRALLFFQHRTRISSIFPQMSYRSSVVAVAVTMTVTLASSAAAEPSSPDPQAIEAAIQAGDFARAETSLQQKGATALNEKVRTRLLGVLRFRQQRYADAEVLFGQAVQDTPDDQSVRLYWATTLLALERYQRVLEVLPAKATATQPIGFRFLRAQAHTGLAQPEAAYAELVAAQRFFPNETRTAVEMVLLSTREDQIGVAIGAAEHLLTLEPTRDDVVTVAQLLSPYPQALPLLERLTAVFPEDAKLQLAGAYAFSNAGLARSAAAAFGRAHAIDPTVGAWEAADQLLQAGETDRALQTNGHVLDDTKRLPQRLRILFEARQMARVVAMTAELERLDLVDPTARYQLAYAHYTLHEPVKASKWARTLVGTDLESAGTALLEAMGVAAAGDPAQ